MKTTDLARLVMEMRHAQKEYFRTKSKTALGESKRLEEKVDRACFEVLDGQRDLF